jgi:hypothetical protein
MAASTRVEYGMKGPHSIIHSMIDKKKHLFLERGANNMDVKK